MKPNEMVIIIPNYNIVEKLGESRQTIAYKAFHKLNPHQPLVVKILKTVLLSKRQKKYFRQKIERLKVLHDSRLITPLSFEARGDVYFFSQPYFEGITLDKWAEKQTEITLDDFFTSKMVGRDREAEIILEEYNKTAEGSFCSLLISGLPGFGKTRLIQELHKPIVEHMGLLQLRKVRCISKKHSIQLPYPESKKYGKDLFNGK